jgi:serine/threonine-protein kinase
MSEVDQPTQDMDNRIGTLLADRYRIERPLGRGGMGTVYRGMQLSVNRPVAIKLISGPLASNPEVVQRFRREAEAMARLGHPNTVRLFEFGVTDDAELFLVMELLEGCDLAQHLTTHGALSTLEALLVARHVLESLSEAHALGIVHRDLKPANIFLSQMHGGQVLARVTDFGIASIQHAAGVTKLTMTGEIMGSPGYMSPEQSMGKPTDARSDVYSLGATLFEMLTGKPVFDAASAASLLLAHATKTPPRLAETRPETTFNAPLEQLVQRMLDKQPEARPQSAEETLHAIDDLLRDLPEPELAPAAPTIRGLARLAPSPTARTHVQAVALAVETPQARNAPPVAAGPESAQRAGYAPVSARRSRTPAALAILAALLAGVTGWKLFNGAQPAGALAANAPNADVASPTERADTARSPHTRTRSQGGPDPVPEPQLRTVRIVSSPRNASVVLQGVELGKTPYKLQFRQETTLTLSLPGYEPATLTVSSSSEPNIAVDLVRSQETSYSSAHDTSGRANTKRPTTQPAGPGPEPEQPTAEAAAPALQDTGPAPAVALPAPPPGPARTTVSAVVGTAPAQPAAARNLTRRERQRAMLSQGSPYHNVVAAKRAYRAGQLDATLYDDVIWVLKAQRNNEIAQEKTNYRRALISRNEYERRVRRIKLAYEGE